VEHKDNAMFPTSLAVTITLELNALANKFVKKADASVLTQDPFYVKADV
jgi:hypothetical protein